MLVAASSDASDFIRDLIFEFGISLDDKGTFVADHHLRNASSDENVVQDHTTILASTLSPETSIISDAVAKGSPILYRGTAMKFNSNPLLAKVLTGSASSYSAEPRPDFALDSDPFAVGKGIVLVGSLQATNNARVTVSGSIEMFSNKLVDPETCSARLLPICVWLNHSSPSQLLDRFLTSQVSAKSGSAKAGNAAFVEELSKWTFHERGVLHVRSVRHHKEGETHQPDKYRIKDNVVYIAEIAEYHDGAWRPFAANDIQFEAIMLDPYVRTTLKGRTADKGATSREFAGHFQLPDQYGVFTFKMDYRRRGYTWISAKETISVVQFRREYPLCQRIIS